MAVTGVLAEHYLGVGAGVVEQVVGGGGDAAWGIGDVGGVVSN